MWPRLAAHLGVDASLVSGPSGAPQPLEVQMAGREDDWAALAARHGLVEPDLARVASWWHTDADLGREMEVVTDMGKSREAGFVGFRRTERAFTELFDRYRAAHLVP
jgi:hypothetical protein